MPEPSIGEIGVEEARARMLGRVATLGVERVPLAEALGRTLAASVSAMRDQPPFAVSAMDGYAVRTDAGFEEEFAVIAESAAGHPWRGDVAAGEAVRVFTGAAVPPGCRVVVQERARREGDRVRFEPHEPASDNVRPQGGDFSAGEFLLKAGARLDAWRIALVAAAGLGSVEVAVRPRIGILSTGEEIVPAGTPAGPEHIYDSNGPALAALVDGWGGVAMPLGPVGDDEAAIAAAVGESACDLVVVIGGASVGDHDLVKPALRRGGLALDVDTVRMRPGKPVWFGHYRKRLSVLGLPGNPASALVCAELFLRPLLRAMQGGDPKLPLEYARLGLDLPAGGPREHWMRAELSSDGQGLTARPFGDQESGWIGIFARADGLARRPAGAPPAKAGEVIEVLRLNRL